MTTEDQTAPTTQPRNPSPLAWWLIVLHLSVLLTGWNAAWIDAPAREERLARHELVMQGGARGPYQYQVLVPFGLEAARQLGGDTAFLAAQALLRFLSCLGCAWCLRRMLVAWMDERTAFHGVLLYFAVLPFTLSDVYGAPLNCVNDFVFFAGLALLESITRTSGDTRRTAHVAFLALVTAGMLNEIWPVFLVAAYLLLCAEVPIRAAAIPDDIRRKKTDWRIGIIYIAAAGIAYLLPRYGYGPRDPFRYWTDHLDFNTRHASTLWAGLLFLPLWILGLWNLYRKPWFMRRLFPLAMIYAIALVFQVHLSETVHLPPLLALILPPAVVTIFGGGSRGESGAVS